jgi:hypothetical protein
MASCASAAQRGLCPPVALQPSAGYGQMWLCSPARAMASCGSVAQLRLWPPRPRGFLITHNDVPQSVGLLWTSDQLVAETSTWQRTKHTTEKIHDPGGIRTHDRNRRSMCLVVVHLTTLLLPLKVQTRMLGLLTFNAGIKSLRATLPVEIFTGILIFKGLTARCLYMSFGVKGLISD